jgi:methyl acetate hydrolase
MEARLNEAFKAAVDAKKVPGVSAIVLDRSGHVIYKGVFGTTNIDDTSAPPVTETTPTTMWSCTKLVATVAALQLMEQGKFQLDDLVEKFVPKIQKLQVLDGFDEKGEPKYRAPKNKPTILHLMTHTAGLSYDFFDKPTLRWRAWSGRDPATYITTGQYLDVETPFIFDAGERHNYGCSTDWLGFVVEAISGIKLNEYVEKNILKPLEMNDSGSVLKGRKFDVHVRGENGKLTANPGFENAVNAEMYGGGHYLYSTLNDFSNFLLTILNNGKHPKIGVRILQDYTVSEYLFQDQIHKVSSADLVGKVTSCIPQVSLSGEFLPGIAKGWSCGLMLNAQQTPKGRSAGSGFWCGLGNLYYWVDPKAGKLGLFVTEILPFLDIEATHLFDEFERAVYGHEASKGIGEKANNYAPLKSN